MKPVSGKHLWRVLERRGWRLVRVNGSHHIFTLPGNPNTIAVPVHGNKTLNPNTQRRIMRAAGLTDADL